MGFIYQERPSDSPLIETVTQGYTAGTGSMVRPAESNWHMVLARFKGQAQFILTGPLTAAGVVPFDAGAEILWIKLSLGTFISHLPVRKMLDAETVLPEAASQSFWLKGSAWQFPNFENVEIFIERLARQDVLRRDPIVTAALQGRAPAIPARTLRHRFLHSTGLTQTYIRQMQRAQQASALLRQGVSILDTVFEAGYFDQPHLTRSLKHFIGHTPAQLAQRSSPDQVAV